jgi:hypothetical protein
MVIISATYCITLAYIYYHGIIDHSGITFKVSHSISPTKPVLRIRIRIRIRTTGFGPTGSTCFWASRPGSGSISQRYGSGSASGLFYDHEKIVRNTLIPTIL